MLGAEYVLPSLRATCDKVVRAVCVTGAALPGAVGRIALAIPPGFPGVGNDRTVQVCVCMRVRARLDFMFC